MDWGLIALAGSTTLLSLSHVIRAAKVKKFSGRNELRIKRIVEVYDGDTIFVDLEGIPHIFGDRIGIRMHGIDCPEIRTTHEVEKMWGMRAKAYVEHVIETSESVELIELSRDKFFRVGATVLVDGEDLSKMILNEGLALKYSGGARNHKPWRKKVRKHA